MALPYDLATATQEHLQSLIDEAVSEGSHLDFKRELPPNWDNKAKHNLTSDISAFANAGVRQASLTLCSGTASELRWFS
jgi:hypothetical protein